MSMTIAETANSVFCDLETYLCPRTVLFKQQDKRSTLSSEGSGSGEEQHTSSVDNCCHMRTPVNTGHKNLDE
jgi:hypothetical protein